MKEYKLVYLNRGLNLSRDKDIKKAEDIINYYVAKGWNLQQIVSPADLAGALVGVFWRDDEVGQ